MVKPGDSLNGILKNIGIDSQDIYEAMQTLKFFYNPRSLKVGQEISAVVQFLPGKSTPHKRLHSLSVKTSPHTEIFVERHFQKDFLFSEKEIDFDRELAFAEGNIENNLFETFQKMGLPQEAMVDVFHAFSYDVDFERDIQVGNTIRVVYERFNFLNGEFSHFGKILYASLELDNLKLSIYRHTPNDGEAEFFMEDGTSVKKSLMKTPIPSASISSNYGMRRHPISVYTRFHKGVDFRASKGTPIMAAGDGVVQFKGRRGGYGNYLIIRHHGNLATAYAHISKYANGIKVGTRVKQGEVVAYVGATGRATGPHLHYELLIQGQRVNPLTYRSTPGTKLKGPEFRKFINMKQEIHAVIDKYKEANYASHES